MIYQIYLDNELIYSSDSPDKKYSVISPVLVQSLNAPDELTFSKTHDLNIDRRSIYRVLRDGIEISRGRPKSSSMAFNKTTTVKYEGQMAFFKDSVQTFHEYENVTTSDFLNAVLTAHNSQVETYKQFRLGNVGINVTIDTYTNFESTYDTLCQLVNDHGGFFRFRSEDGNVHYLDYLAYNGGGLATQEVRFGENLLDFSRNVSLGSFYTSIVPLGARVNTGEVGDGPEERVTIASVNGGSVSVSNSGLVNLYGRITKTKIYDDISNPATLKSTGTRDLESQLDGISLSVKFIDLHLTDPDIPSFIPGNQIHVVSEPHGLDKNFVLTELTLEMDNPAGSKITLGRSGSARISTTAGQSVATTLKVANSTVTRSGVVEAAQKLADKMFSTDGSGSYVTFDTDSDGVVQQIIIMDSPDASLATKKLVINQNGVGGSDDGGRTFKTAITTDGWIYGNRIIAGTLLASQIQVAINKLGTVIDLQPSCLQFKRNGNLVSVLDANGTTYHSGNGVKSASFTGTNGNFFMDLFQGGSGKFTIRKWNAGESSAVQVFALEPRSGSEGYELNMYMAGGVTAGELYAFNSVTANSYKVSDKTGRTTNITINGQTLKFVGGILVS